MLTKAEPVPVASIWHLNFKVSAVRHGRRTYWTRAVLINLMHCHRDAAVGRESRKRRRCRSDHGGGHVDHTGGRAAPSASPADDETHVLPHGPALALKTLVSA